MKTVSLLSGGADSSTLLYYLITDPAITEIAPLAVNYNQRHKKEIESAQKVVETLQKEILGTGVRKKVLPLKVVEFPIGLFGGSPLVDMTDSVPNQDEQKQAKTVVPYRNTILATLAASYTKSLGYDAIAMGPTLEDLPNYPDCRPIYFKALTDALRLGDTVHNLKILVPFIDFNKGQIYKIGTALKVPYEHTWTCYNGREKACGECDACKERIAGFVEMERPDPIEYEKAIDWKSLYKK